ncbi:MAG: hypothetical protein RIT24_3182 [Planctomycetota bacterium]
MRPSWLTEQLKDLLPPLALVALLKDHPQSVAAVHVVLTWMVLRRVRSSAE